jgi:hypothetical protein
MPQVKAAPPAPATKKLNATDRVGAAAVLSAHDQFFYEEKARTIAEQLGWAGEDHWVGNGIQVKDAKRYLCKILHEVHQAVVNGKEPPSAEKVCEHLGLDDKSEIASMLSDAVKRETEEHKSA